MSAEIPNVMSMRIVGSLLVVASIIQIGVAGAAYAMTSWHVGSWWAGVFACVTGIFALISANKGIVTTGCIFSVISILLCIAGVIFDGIIYGATNALDTCGDRTTGQIYGDTQYTYDVGQCAIQNSQTCLCVQGGNSDTCFLFNLDSADNCGQILTKLPSLLLASLLFVFLLLILVFTYSILTCMGVCCVKPPLAGQNATPTTATATANPVAATTVKATPVTANSV